MDGKFLQDRRVKKSISQEDLARKCNISVSSIRNWEQGLRDPNKISLETFKKIIYFLEIPVEEGL